MAIIEDNWNYKVENVQTEKNRDFELQVNCLRDEILSVNVFHVQQYSPNDNARSPDDELKVLIETNKQLRHEIDTKLEELGKQKKQYETFKKDQKLLSQEIKDTHEAFLMAKKYYKKFLKLYYTIEAKNDDKQTIYLQFFTEAKKESENYSVRLLRHVKSERYELLETNPKLDIVENLRTRLQETNDVPGLLCHVRKAFLKIKTSKKL